MGIPFPCSGEKKGNSVKKFCFALLPFDDCVVISRARKLDRNMDMRRMNSSYVKGFYLRCTASGFFDIEFSSFFDYQFRVYLTGRRDFSIPLCEGDEVCSLIKDTFEQMKISLSHSPFDIQADGEWNLLKDLRIDFREKRTPFLIA